MNPNVFQTGGALQGAVAASLIRQREAAAALQPGDRIGIYRVVRELGRGGMAMVYLAERDDGEYQQQVALKWMQGAQTDATIEAMFRRERQALADLSHPHIARLLDGGRSEAGRPWFAMEYIDGEPLDRHCISRALTLTGRLGLFRQLCAAVAYAHAHGVIHRDIKPSNVLIDAQGNAKLLDFGIAQLLGEVDVPGARAFTPGFASPEQVRGEALTVASDVYQLGRLLAALLSSNEHECKTIALREADQITGLLAPSEATMPAPTPAVPGGLSADLRAILGRALMPEPSQRYPTVAALAGDVDALMQHRPVSARPRRAAYVFGRFVRRHPLGMAIGTAVAAVIVGGSLYFTERLRGERDAATHQARVANSVLAFMQEDLLAAADPSAAPGRELTVREALDIASTSADARFRDLPVEHASLRTTLARLYDQLGRYDEAEREARRAVTLADQSSAPALSHDRATYALASALMSRDRLDDAQQLIVGLEARLSERGQESLHDLLEVQLVRVDVLVRQGKYDDALALAQSLEEKATSSFGAGDALVASAREKASDALRMLGRHDEALVILENTLTDKRARLGELHPYTLLTQHDVGVVKRHQGKSDEALRWLQPALEGRRKVLGAHHPQTLQSINEVATALQELKRYDEAESFFVEALEQRRITLGEEHQYTRNSMSNLGLLYSLWGKLDMATPLYERTLELDTRLNGSDHPDTLSLTHNIAGLYRKQRRTDDALTMHARAIAGGEAVLGPEAWQTALFRVGHAQTLQTLSRWDEADAEFGRAIATLESSLGPDHARTQRAREMRAALSKARKVAASQ